LNTTIGPNESGAIGGIRVSDDKTVNPYSTETGCTFSVMPGAGERLAIDGGGGKIWANVNCHDLVDPSTLGAACNVDNGYFVFEKCAK
jgi:hypothetical protein